jgi:hypothetical protein
MPNTQVTRPSIWKGTPGPFGLIEDGEANRFHIMRPSGNWLMAVQHNGEQLVREQRINMRAMAAAPRLVDALAELLAETFEQGGPTTRAMQEAANALREAAH